MYKYIYCILYNYHNNQSQARVKPDNSAWFEDANLKNLIVCQPDNRNIYNKIYGDSSCGRPLNLLGQTLLSSASHGRLSCTWTTSSSAPRWKLERCCTSTPRSASPRATTSRSGSRRRCSTRSLAR